MVQTLAPKILEFNNHTNLRNWVPNYVPSLDEVQFFKLMETGECIIKIGDGKTKLCDLPIMERNMRLDYEFGAPWINKMIDHIPEEVWKRAEKAVKSRKQIYHVTDVIVEAVKILSEEYDKDPQY